VTHAGGTNNRQYNYVWGYLGESSC